MRIIPFLCLMLISFWVIAQQQNNSVTNDSLSKPAAKTDIANSKHSPKKAAVLSAVLPGAGQVYNHQPWKVAFVYGGLGALAYFIYDNNRIYKDYRTQWTYLTDLDSTTMVRPELSLASADALHNAFSAFRKYRDQCVIGFVLVYAANIIDANVYAHLYHFNVDDISLHFKPEYNILTRSFTPTARLVYKF